MNWSTKWPEPNEVKQPIKSTAGVDTSWYESGLITKTIEVKYHNKKKVIEVTVIGDLALDFDEDGWNIYHLPTLVCFDNAVPGSYGPLELKYTYDKLPLLNWMDKVQQSYPTSWQMLRLLKPDDYEDKGKTAKEIIQKWCLSVKVE